MPDGHLDEEKEYLETFVINAGHTRRTAVRILSEENVSGKWEAKELTMITNQLV